MVKTLRAAKFLVTGPLILGLLFVINLVTSPGHWWVQWPALGIGIAWVISLVRVITAVVLVGGVAALIAALSGKQLTAARWSRCGTPSKPESRHPSDDNDVVI